MPVQIHLNGQRYFADDGTDPAELQQYAQMHQQEQAQLNPINQGMQGMQNVFSGINRQIQNYNELPAPTAVPGNTYGMSTQAFNQTAGIIQQDNMNSATARMQQRVQMEQAMEQEKDRAQQIKVQEMQFKNQQAMEKMRQQQEEARLKQQGMTRKPITLPGGGLAEYVPGADGQPGTVNTILQPTVKPIAKSYTTMYGNDGTAYGVNRADPNEVLVIKDPVTGEPIKRTAGQTGKRLVNDASGMPYMLDMATGAMDPVDVPEGFSEKSANGMTPIQSLDIQKKAMEVVKLQNGAWIDNDRMSENYGQVKPEFVNAFNAEVARQLQAATGGASPAAAGSPAGGGGMQSTQGAVKVGDTFTHSDGQQYRYLGGGKSELVSSAQSAPTESVAPSAQVPSPTSMPQQVPVPVVAPPAPVAEKPLSVAERLREGPIIAPTPVRTKSLGFSALRVGDKSTPPNSNQPDLMALAQKAVNEDWSAQKVDETAAQYPEFLTYWSEARRKKPKLSDILGE